MSILEGIHLGETSPLLVSRIRTLEEENAALKAELGTWKRVAELQDSSMLNENTRLIAENQKLRLDYLSAETQAGEHFDEVQRLRAELKQVIEERNAFQNQCISRNIKETLSQDKDALRYRWLRDPNNMRHEDDLQVCTALFNVYSMEELDAAIDQAIKESK